MTPTLKRSILPLLTAAIAAGVPLAAAAQTPCAQWDVSQPWVAMQSNNFRTTFRLRQTGTSLQGTGEVYTPPRPVPLGAFGGTGNPHPVTGTVKGNSIELEASWGGVYIGTIDDTGRIDGRTYDKRDSTSSANWYSDRRMNCLARVQASAPPPKAPAQPAQVPTTTTTGGVKSTSGASAAGGARAMLGGERTPAPVAVPRTTCKSGYVWRVARPTDLVCVTPKSRERVAKENSTAAKRVQPGGGAYGPNTCRSGYVWREAFVGDLVCVTPKIRTLVQKENQLAASRLQ